MNNSLNYLKALNEGLFCKLGGIIKLGDIEIRLSRLEGYSVDYIKKGEEALRDVESIDIRITDKLFKLFIKRLENEDLHVEIENIPID